MTITAQLYASDALGDVLVPLPGAECVLSPPLTGFVVMGSISSCQLTGLSAAVPAGTTVITVFRAEATGVAIIYEIYGHLAAGVAMS